MWAKADLQRIRHAEVATGRHRHYTNQGNLPGPWRRTWSKLALIGKAKGNHHFPAPGKTSGSFNCLHPKIKCLAVGSDSPVWFQRKRINKSGLVALQGNHGGIVGWSGVIVNLVRVVVNLAHEMARVVCEAQSFLLRIICFARTVWLDFMGGFSLTTNWIR